jgi:hypothetical protein
MLSVRREGVRRQHGEVRDVAGDNRPSFSRSVRELGSIIELCVADLVGADDLEAPRAKHLGQTRREVLVEVQLHSMRTTRTRPG